MSSFCLVSILGCFTRWRGFCVLWILGVFCLPYVTFASGIGLGFCAVLISGGSMLASGLVSLTLVTLSW